MSRILFASWPGAGNQSPAIGAADALRARGHTVTFAGYSLQRRRFVDCGFDFVPLAAADALWPTEPPLDWMSVLVDLVWACPAHLSDLDTAAADQDVLVLDCLMYGMLAAAEQRDLPTAVLVHSAPGALCPPGGGMDALVLNAVNALRARCGLPTLRTCWEAWLPFSTICTSALELDPLAGELPEEIQFVGPVPEPATPSGWQPPWSPSDRRPLVAASFSTGPAWEQRSRIDRTLRALDGGDYRVLVTTAMADTEDLPVPRDAVLVPHVPHGEVLGEASALVTHAGHGTVAAALTHELPMVFLPNPAADQPVLAAHLAGLGAGVALDGETASPAQIREAVRTVLAEPGYTAAAKRFGAVLRSMPAAAGAALLIERLA